jgi:hypothetical protein
MSLYSGIRRFVFKNQFIIQLHQIIIDNIFQPVFQNSFSLFMPVNFILLLHEEGVLSILSFIATTRSIKRNSAGNAKLS